MCRVYIFIFILLVGIVESQLAGQNRTIEDEFDQRRPHHFNLLTPEKNLVVSGGSLEFTWENYEDPDLSYSPVSYYEVAFWSENLSLSYTDTS